MGQHRALYAEPRTPQPHTLANPITNDPEQIDAQYLLCPLGIWGVFEEGFHHAGLAQDGGICRGKSMGLCTCCYKYLALHF